MATTPDITGGLDCEESQKPQLKPIEESLQKFVHKAFDSAGERGQAVKNFLNGTWIGEPLHVILTDIPIGAWTVALVFDGLDFISDKRGFALAADASIGIGLVGAAGAAVTGVTDWQDVDAPARRIGMIHGLLNVTATALFATSLVLRKRKSRTSGRILAVLGYGVMTYAAHLGGKMVYNYRVGVDRTDGEVFPPDFVAVMSEAELAEAKPTRAEHDGVPILPVRRGDRIFCAGGDLFSFQRTAFGRRAGRRQHRLSLAQIQICVGGWPGARWTGCPSPTVPPGSRSEWTDRSP